MRHHPRFGWPFSASGLLLGLLVMVLAKPLARHRKRNQDDLTPSQAKALGRLIREELK